MDEDRKASPSPGQRILNVLLDPDSWKPGLVRDLLLRARTDALTEEAL